MLQAHGDDRVRELPDGSIEVHSNLDKGWRGTRARTNTSAEFPGTPVNWNERWFEVTFVRRLKDGGRVYVLRPWRADHPMRNPSRYDAESEAGRLAEHAQTETRRTNTLGIAVAGLVIGHIPAHAQHEVEREYGLSAITLSLISLVLPFLFVVWVAARLPITGLPPPHASEFESSLAGWLIGESILRFLLIMKMSSPWGSVEGLIAYELWRKFTRAGAEFEKRAAVGAEDRLRSHSDRVADAATSERDAYELREPFLAFLSAREQEQLQSTFGFDPRKHGLRTAVVIGLFSLLGMRGSIMKILGDEATFWTWSSLLVAAFLFAEQAWRLKIILGGKPAGSVLAALVRPGCRALLATKPTALRKGSVQAAKVHLPEVWDGKRDYDQTGR